MASITEASLREAITQRLGAIHVEVTDMSGTAHSKTHITNPPSMTSKDSQKIFQNLRALQRHRLVNTALKDEIAAIHAWTAKCQTPQEWDKEKDTAAPSLEGTVGGHVEGTSQ
ncbi:hypothetical protein TrVFT333_003857 [Trichoderma virens FT-333]|nr:hypothetical protein TrVFT333_003857 [Trichoderma virens FT-333]